MYEPCFGHKWFMSSLRSDVYCFLFTQKNYRFCCVKANSRLLNAAQFLFDVLFYSGESSIGKFIVSAIATTNNKNNTTTLMRMTTTATTYTTTLFVPS